MPWLLVVSPTPNLVANMMVRGPFPVNCVQLIPARHGDLQQFSESVEAAMSKADSLCRIPYAGVLADKVPDSILVAVCFSYHFVRHTSWTFLTV